MGILIPAKLLGADDPGTVPGSLSISPQGTATYTVPIQCPPGTAGMTPTISLAYNSDTVAGASGAGWSVQGFSTITRGTKTIDQDGYVKGPTFTKNDALFLDGARLIPVRVDSDTTEYRTEVDGYAKILASQWGNDGPVRPS